MEDMLDKLAEAIKGGTKEEQQTAISAIQGNGGMSAAYLSMFGAKKIEDVVVDQRNLEALGEIKKAIEKGRTAGEFKDTTTAAQAQDIIRGSLQGGIREGSAELGGAWEKTAKKAPSVYAARSKAMRDHTYAFYRGKQREMVDNASQAEIWDKMGIETPSGAAQEAVADELYTKNFKNMNYDQLMAAQKAHKEYMAGKQRAQQPIDDKDRLIGLAILNKFFEESWVDDGSMAVYAKDMKMDMNSFERIKKRGGRGPGGAIRMRKDDIGRLSGGLGSLGTDFSQTLVDSIRRGEQKAVDEFTTKFKSKIQANQHAFNGKSLDEIVHVIQHAEADQFRELIDAALSKAGGK
jgi:hypothetical protein